jgi:hypothetical protein
VRSSGRYCTGICAAECIEIDVVSAGEMSAEVVFVAAAGIENDRSFGGIRVIDQLLCFSDGDGADFGGVAVADERECECCEELGEHIECALVAGMSAC